MGALNSLQADMPMSDALLPLISAQHTLAGLLGQTLVPLRSSREAAERLMVSMQHALEGAQLSDPFSFEKLYPIQAGLVTFNTAFSGESGVADTYAVSQKGGYDTSSLISSGEVIFPSDLPRKVPEAVTDLREAGKCLAFEVCTAGAFHIHRANEAVVHRYYDAVTGGRPRPTTRNMGDYLNALERHDAGDKRVRAALRDLKDLHRNPLVHPDDSLKSFDELVALVGAVHAVMVYMLAAIPDASSAPVASEPGA